MPAARCPMDAAQKKDIRELKKLLLDDEEQIARNLVRQLLVYATGAPIHFADRAEIERILADTKTKDFGVKSLVHEVVGSVVFQMK